MRAVNRELEARTAELGEQEQSITARGEELDTRESELAEERTALDKRDGEASERERTLLDRETDIRQRETNAERGFIKERQEMLSQLDEAREAFRSELAEKWQASEARLKEREDALDERDDQLAGERRELANVKRRLGYEQAELEELRADLDDRAERRAAAIREKLEHTTIGRSQPSSNRPATTGTDTRRCGASARTPTASSASAHPRKC